MMGFISVRFWSGLSMTQTAERHDWIFCFQFSGCRGHYNNGYELHRLAFKISVTPSFLWRKGSLMQESSHAVSDVREMPGPTLSSAVFQKGWAAAATTAMKITTTTTTTEHIIYQDKTLYQIPSLSSRAQGGDLRLKHNCIGTDTTGTQVQSKLVMSKSKPPNQMHQVIIKAAFFKLFFYYNTLQQIA